MNPGLDKLEVWLWKAILEQISGRPAIISEKSWKINEVLIGLRRANLPLFLKWGKRKTQEFINPLVKAVLPVNYFRIIINLVLKYLGLYFGFTILFKKNTTLR